MIEAVGAQRRQEPEADLVSQRRKASAKTVAINSIEFCESGSNPTNHSKMFPSRSAWSSVDEARKVEQGSNVVGGWEEANFRLVARRNAVSPRISEP